MSASSSRRNRGVRRALVAARLAAGRAGRGDEGDDRRRRCSPGTIEGRFLELLVAGTGAKRMLEIGTFTGYSALSMAAALPRDGRIDTLDIEPKHAEVAQRYFDAAPTAARSPASRPGDRDDRRTRGRVRFRLHRCGQGELRRVFRGRAAAIVGGRPDRDRQHALERAVLDPPDETTRLIAALNDKLAGDDRVGRPADGARRRHARPPPLTGHVRKRQ